MIPGNIIRYGLRLALLLAIVATAAIAAHEPTRANQGPFHVFLVVWRGITDAERGFMDYLTEKKVPVEFTIRDCNNNAKALPSILAEIRKKRPDLVYTFGTTATKFIAGPAGANDPERYLTDIPVIFNIVAKPIGSKLVPLPEPEKDISASIFEAKILSRIEKKDDRDFLLDAYNKGNRGRSYLLRQGLKNDEQNRLLDIFLRISFVTMKSGRNLTGCSHLVPMDAQMNAIRSMIDVKRIGVLFNPAEDNAIQQVDELASYCRENNLELVRVSFPLDKNMKPLKSDIPVTVAILAGQGIHLAYIPSDSFIIANAALVMEEFNRRGIKTFSTTEDPVRKAGALMGLVSRYYNVGQFAGYKAAEILVDRRDPGTISIEALNRYSFVVNMDTACRINYYPPVSILKFAEIIKNTDKSIKREKY